MLAYHKRVSLKKVIRLWNTVLVRLRVSLFFFGFRIFSTCYVLLVLLMILAMYPVVYIRRFNRFDGLDSSPTTTKFSMVQIFVVSKINRVAYINITVGQSSKCSFYLSRPAKQRLPSWSWSSFRCRRILLFEHLSMPG